jgi:HK97 family phage prohead protease
VTSGLAMRMKLDLSRYRRTPPAFTPLPPLAPVDHDVIVEGYAAPAVVDREFMKFAHYSWTPLPKQTPLLVKHDANRLAGEILEAFADDRGLFIKARLTDDYAKRLSHFSVTATIRDYRIQNADDPKHAFALVTNCALVEVSMTDIPANPAAKILYRDRSPPALAAFDIALAGVGKMRELVALLQEANAAPPASVKPKHPNATAPKLSGVLKRAPEVVPPRVVPHRRGAFGQLITELEKRHHV